MTLFSLREMKGGWIVGDFDPCVLRCTDAEFGIKNYRQGETNEEHYHKIATEVTVVVAGICRMGSHVLTPGQIVVVRPGESSDFEALENCTVIVFKTPSVVGDKYPGRAV